MKAIKNLIVLIVSMTLFTSCYTYTSVVGEGAQGNEVVKEPNHYVAFGLAPIKVSDSKEMADGAENYTVTTEQTLVNGLVTYLTFGLYTPSTTTVTK